MKKLFLFLTLISVSILTAGEFILAGSGKAADLVVPANSSYGNAARWLQKYVEKISGVKPQIVTGSNNSRVEFAISGKLDQDGFTVSFPQKGVMLITGGSPIALEYAALDILERFAGCRWLFPGPVGEFIPKSASIAIPDKTYSDAPAFLSRNMSWQWTPFLQKYGHDFQVQARVRTFRVNFHHNLGNLFDVKIFADTHPWFYPVYDGKRLNPLQNTEISWQPCFTAPGLVDTAVDRIKEVFRKRPGQRTYSLGANDIYRYCECPNCLKSDGNKLNGCNYRDRSTSFIRFANQVAEKVTAEYPDATFGFLAYQSLWTPPAGEKVNKALIPFLCYDRMQWLVPDKKQLDQMVTDAWYKKNCQVGWYDYARGRCFLMPRLYPHLMGQYLKWGNAHGVRHYYAECYPSEDWHEGPKFYIMGKLLWNPDQDVDKLLTDWCEKAVGKKAAPYLKKYYANIEKYWYDGAVKTDFFKVKDIYLDFKSHGYLDNYTMAELDANAALMKKVVELADNKERAQFIYNGFAAREKDLRNYIKNRQAAAGGADSFPQVLLDEKFEKGIIASWKGGGTGKFFHAKGAGINGSNAAGINTDGANRSTMCYLSYPSTSGCRDFVTTVRYKAENVDGARASVHLSIAWQRSKNSDPNSSEVEWLPSSFTAAVRENVKSDGQWHTMTVFGTLPDSSVTRMVINFSVKESYGGKVYVDDLSVKGRK